MAGPSGTTGSGASSVAGPASAAFGTTPGGVLVGGAVVVGADDGGTTVGTGVTGAAVEVGAAVGAADDDGAGEVGAGEVGAGVPGAVADGDGEGAAGEVEAPGVGSTEDSTTATDGSTAWNSSVPGLGHGTESSARVVPVPAVRTSTAPMAAAAVPRRSPPWIPVRDKILDEL